MQAKGGGESLLILLEPGNVAKLQLGEPIVKDLKEFLPDFPPLEIVIGYCPDVQFVSAQVKAGMPFAEALQKSLDRPEVYVRPHEAEYLVKQVGPDGGPPK
jgi:hypothetical protein